MHWLEDHQVACAIAGCWIFAAVAPGMPAPTPDSSVTYRWAYSSLNIMAANLEAAVRARVPSAPLPGNVSVSVEAQGPAEQIEKLAKGVK